MPHIIGIDLGTTFSAVAHVDEMGKPAILTNRDGHRLTPSVIAFTPAGPVFGEEAKSLQSLGEANVASFFKRWMGDAGFYLDFAGKRYDATALAALLLGKLKSDAEAALGGEVKKAVITVPAYFNNFQREATVRAGKMAGLDVLRIINEPTAAAIAYGMNKSKDGQTLLVYDLGGGTFDVTLVESTAGSLRVIATDGDHQLGGKDWNDRIMQHVALQFREEFGINPLADVETMNDLLVQCEAAKVKLSQSAAARVRVFCDGEKAAYDITREWFEEMTDDLVDRTKTLCRTVMEEAGMDWPAIDGILLVGGSTRMPMIARAVEEISGKQAIYGIDIDEAVAIGAAIQAAMDAENDPSLPKLTAKRPALAGRKTVEDVTSHSLGMIAENADRSQYVNAIILPRNSAIPGRETRPLTFRTTPGRDLELDVYLLQGESQAPGDCATLGKYVFSGIQDEPGGKAVLEITYAYDQNGIVSVSGLQRSTGRALAMRVEPVPEDMGWVYGSPTAKGLASGGHVTVIIAVDCSGSMDGKPMREAQNAAREFVRKIDLAHFSVGIMAFADSTLMLAEPSQDVRQIEAAIAALADCRDVGFGNESQPFTDIYDRLCNAAGAKFLIVLTDGIWYNPKHSVEEAAKCRNNDIRVIAIGFGDAKANFLREIASCDENALFTDVSRLGSSFSTIAQVLTESGGQLRKVFKGISGS